MLATFFARRKKTAEIGRAAELDPRVRAEIVAFLRQWLPHTAIETYRSMIESDPEGWNRHSHFADDIVVKHLFRGNGITEEALGIDDLHSVWPELLREAVEESPSGETRGE
jgi:hypothetical protein